MTNLYARTDAEIAKLEDILQRPTTIGQYKSHCEMILSDLKKIQVTLKSYNPFDAENLAKFKEQLKTSVHGTSSLTAVQLQADKEVVKQSCFPSYVGKTKVKGYYVTKCTCNLCGPLIYPRFVAAHGQFPNNDQVPLYFIQQLYAEVHLGMSVNYLDLPDYYGQGKGRLRDRDQYRRQGVDRAVDLRQVVDRPRPFVTGFQNVAAPLIESAQEGAIEGVASIARQTQFISSTRVGEFLQRRDRESQSGSSADDNDYLSARLVSPADVRSLADTSQLRRVAEVFASDLLVAYKYISTTNGISLENVMDVLERFNISSGDSIGNPEHVPTTQRTQPTELNVGTSAPDVHIHSTVEQGSDLPLLNVPEIGDPPEDIMFNVPTIDPVEFNVEHGRHLPMFNLHEIGVQSEGNLSFTNLLFRDTPQGMGGIDPEFRLFDNTPQRPHSGEGSTGRQSTPSVERPPNIDTGVIDVPGEGLLEHERDSAGSESRSTTRRRLS